MRKIKMGFVAVLAGALLGAVAPMAAAADEKPASDLTLIPQDAAGFITLRVAGIWDDDTVKGMLKTLEKTPEVLGEMEKYLGMEVKQVERLTLMLPPSAGRDDSPLVIFTTVKPYDQEKVREGMAKKGEKKTVGDKVYYAGQHTAVYFVNDRTVVTGEPKVLAAYLDKKLDITKDARFKSAADLVAKNTLVGMVDLSPYSKDIQKDLPPTFKGTEPLFAASPAFVTVTGSKDLALTAKLTYKDEDAAKSAEKAAHTTAEALRQLVIEGQKELAKQATRPETQKDAYAQWAIKETTSLLKEFEDNLKKAEVSQKGKEVEVTMQSKASPARVAVTMISSMFMIRGSSEKPPDRREDKK